MGEQHGDAVGGVVDLPQVQQQLPAGDAQAPGDRRVGPDLIYFLLGIVYFAVAGRHRLVLSPEEEFAMTRGEHGHPEREGYGTTHVTDIEPEAARKKETPTA